MFCEHGRPAIATRLIAGLHYLKHMCGLSDDEVEQRWAENPYWQYFCGETYFQHELPLNPSSLSRWRKRLGEAGVESLLSATIEAALALAKRLLAQQRQDKINCTQCMRRKWSALPRAKCPSVTSSVSKSRLPPAIDPT